MTLSGFPGDHRLPSRLCALLPAVYLIPSFWHLCLSCRPGPSSSRSSCSNSSSIVRLRTSPASSVSQSVSPFVDCCHCDLGQSSSTTRGEKARPVSRGGDPPGPSITAFGAKYLTARWFPTSTHVSSITRPAIHGKRHLASAPRKTGSATTRNCLRPVSLRTLPRQMLLSRDGGVTVPIDLSKHRAAGSDAIPLQNA